MAKNTAGSSMLELWEKYYNSNKGFKKDWYRLAKKPEIDYVKADMFQRWRLIVDALLFWRFILNNRPQTFAQLREFLDVIIADTKTYSAYVRLVAMIEYLPKTVWRKLLWRQNIDFMGFEAFLRRLSQKQCAGITRAYLEFKSGKRPNVFTWYDRNIKWVSFKSLAKEELDYNDRYATKAAMSYNLFNLDFGFNAFPKGIYDDTKVVEISPLRFVSKKQHADDFSVNKEDGMYWWLYRRARANYVISPNREVTLHKAICPGFWYTLIVHLLFWIISPIATLITTTVWSDSVIPQSLLGWFAFVPLVFASLLTPLWLIIATVKLVFSSIVKFIKLLPKKVWETLFSVFIAVCVPVLVGLIIPHILALFKLLAVDNPWRQILWTSMFFFFVRSLFKIEKKSDENKTFPIKYKIVGMRFWGSFPSASRTFFKIAFGLLVGSYLYDYYPLVWGVISVIGEFIASIAVIVASAIWSFILLVGNSFAIFFKEWGTNILLMLSVIVLPILALVLIDKYSDDRKYPKVSQYIIPLGRLMMFISVVLCAVMVYTSYVSLSERLDAGILIAPLIGYILLVLAVVILTMRSERKHDKRLEENAGVFAYYGTGRAIQLTYIAIKNKFFLSLSIKERSKFVANIRELSQYYGEKFGVITYIGGSNAREWCENLFLSRIKDWKTVNKLESYKDKSRFYQEERGYNKLEIFLNLVTKMSVADAISKIDNEIDLKLTRQRVRKQKRSNFFAWLFSPITRSWNYMVDWKKFWDHLHERCPYVAESKDLLKNQQL